MPNGYKKEAAMGDLYTLEDRIERDGGNAIIARDIATKELEEFRVYKEQSNITEGASSFYKNHLNSSNRRLDALRQIVKNPFHAMVEVYTNSVPLKPSLWYANIHSTNNEVLNGSGEPIVILSWTHPGFQLALVGALNEEYDIEEQGYLLKSVTPLARAKFSKVIPTISGIYDPGGSVKPEEGEEPAKGLKAVKLDMTSDQVHAFISRMHGMLMITGAPGSGKTTVAFQRVRFLYDQHGELRKQGSEVNYSPEYTKIFLANENLIRYSNKLLVEDLDIPDSVVSLVPEFISQYLSERWAFKHEARLRPHLLSPLEKRAREAFFGLCKAEDLIDCWMEYEGQIASRLSTGEESDWFSLTQDIGGKTQSNGEDLVISLITISESTRSKDPLRSSFRMDAVFRRVENEYEELRNHLEPSLRDQFDKKFQRWLYWVYDPFDALISYFSEHMYQAQNRIKRGTASRVREDEIIEGIRKDWNKRYYGPEEEPWLSWLMRFVLPEEADFKNRFREITWALPAIDAGYGERYSHVVIDEAQDLSVPQASLLVSLVDLQGALTVSADFKQVVSPVHGMTDWEAFRIGCPFLKKEHYQKFPFSKNMRQSRQISRFLQGFYQAAFGEIAPFDSSDQIDDLKPQLYIGRPAIFPRIIRQIISVLKRSADINTVSLIQINEDEEMLRRLREALDIEGVKLAPIWHSYDDMEGLITTSVERIKGLEFDACIIIGLDDVERASLEFTTNRAYVALSRPTRRLAILCEEFPKLLQRVDSTLFDVRKLGA